MRILPTWGDHIRCYIPDEDCQFLLELDLNTPLYLPRLSTPGIVYLVDSIRAEPTILRNRSIITLVSTGPITPETRVLDDKGWELIEKWWD